MRKLIKRVFKLVAILVLCVIALIATTFLYLLAQRGRELTLPAPAGSYPVGRLITTWTDESRLETLGGAPGQKRRLAVWIWYPVQPGGSPVPYMPPDWARATEQDRGAGSLLFQAVDSIHGHATDARPVSTGGPFPVLVFEPGLGPSIPQYTTLAEDLAGRGYVVIGLNPTYSASITVLDGHVIGRSSLGTIADDATPEQAQQRGDDLVEIWAADDRFAIREAARMNGDPDSPFAGRLDVSHIGLLGHSFGGAAAFEACYLDANCSAAVDLDGSPFGEVRRVGLNRPVLLMLSELDGSANRPELEKANLELSKLVSAAPQGYQVTIRGARHFNFTDYAVGFNPLGRLIGILGSIDGARGLRITSEYLAAFFDHTLKGAPASRLRSLIKEFPEVQFTFHD